MAQRRKPPRGPKPVRGHRRTTPPTTRRTERDDDPELTATIRRALGSHLAMDVLVLASGLMCAADPRGRDPFEKADDDEFTVARLAQTFIDVPLPETSALLAAIAVLTDDAVLAARVRRELASRPFAPPSWLTAAAEARIVVVQEMVEALGSGEDIVLAVRLPNGERFCALVYIDHNLGSVAKDAFVVAGSLDRLARRLLAAPEHVGIELRDIDPADARARLTQAVDWGARTYPPYETETWPMCRPLIEWLVRMLPEGGRSWERREWTDDEQHALMTRFLASPHGRGFDDDDHRSLLESILWYGTGYSTLDPLRWAVPKIEVLLLDWVPRKIVADVSYLDKLPDLLTAYVRFAHAAAGVPAALTAEAIEAVERYTPDYREIIRDATRPQGPAALLASLGVPGGAEAESEEPGFHLAEVAQIMRSALVRQVGSDAELDALTDEPLPDEPFDWSGIDEDIAQRVATVLEISDAVVGPLLGIEYRTACRRVLRLAAVGDPAVFRRAAKPEVSAAALCWLVGKANDLFGQDIDQMYVKDLLPHFGVSGSVSQRARSLLGAGGFEWRNYDVEFGRRDLLVSTCRRRICELRDHYAALLAED